MRAKMKLETITSSRYRAEDKFGEQSETLKFRAVAAKSYNSDGMDEDNTYAKFSPSGTIELTVANPALLGKFNPGETYYIDFTPVDEKGN